MQSLIETMIPKIPFMSEAGCLTILHSILRKSRSRMTPELESLITAISDTAGIEKWSLHMQIQAIHSLSRLNVEDDSAVSSLLTACTRESLAKIPSQNLQHLLSIIHNHSDRTPTALWRPVLEQVVFRIGNPYIAYTMPMTTIAVTLGYLGRFPKINSLNVFNTLLNVFICGKTKLVSINPVSLLTKRVISESQIDIAHLTSIVEAIDRLNYWKLHACIPLFLTTTRLALRDGIHNVRAVPLCQLLVPLLKKHVDTTTASPSVDSEIDAVIESVENRGGWSLKTEVGALSQTATIHLLLEGLLRHEQYIKMTPSVIERCLEIKRLIESGNCCLVTIDNVAENVKKFFNELVAI